MSIRDEPGSGGVDSTASPRTGDAEAGSVGFYLSRQRELRGISLEEFAELTRIPIRSLERLEAGRFDQASDGFARGFVRTVADALGLDPDDAVARMLGEAEISEDRRSPTRAALRRVAIAATVLICAGAFVGIVRAVSEAGAQVSGVAEPKSLVRRDPVRALAESQSAADSAQPSPRPGPSRRP